MATGVGVDTRDNHVIRVANFEIALSKAGAECILRGAVVCKTDTVKSVLAVAWVVVALRVANLDAELVATNEPKSDVNDVFFSSEKALLMVWHLLSPPENLRSIAGESGGVQEATNRVTLLKMTKSAKCIFFLLLKLLTPS